MTTANTHAPPVKALVRATFNATAHHFDDAPLFFWDRLGRRTLELANGVPVGGRVLDVCCGTGASALPAAELVGPTGHVLGLDLAERLLDRARSKAEERGLDNVRFVAGDMEHLDVEDESFDLVVCVLGIYFARDLGAAVAGLWQAVKPGGTLAVTTWGARALEPANSLYLASVAAERPDLDARKVTLSWARVNSAALLTDIFASAGTAFPHIVEEVVIHPVTAPDFWTIVLGSGYRIMLDVMGEESRERVRRAFFAGMERNDVRTLAADVLYAAACKTAGPATTPRT